MQLKSLKFIKLVEENLLVSIMRIASNKPQSKSYLNDSLHESFVCNNDEKLIRLALECIYIWNKLYSNVFTEAYQYLLAEGIDFPRFVTFFTEESENFGLIDHNLKINLCKTEILTKSNNEEILFFAIENNIENMNCLLDYSISTEPKDFQSIFYFFSC